MGYLPFWSSFILVVFHVGRLPFWSSSIFVVFLLEVFHFGCVPFRSSTHTSPFAGFFYHYCFGVHPYSHLSRIFFITIVLIRSTHSPTLAGFFIAICLLRSPILPLAGFFCRQSYRRWIGLV